MPLSQTADFNLNIFWGVGFEMNVLCIFVRCRQCADSASGHEN